MLSRVKTTGVVNVDGYTHKNKSLEFLVYAINADMVLCVVK
jgi:hypothetical protein